MYAQSPAWLQALMNAWADGLNYYLATHPDVHPRVITHFEPWMALSFTEGSIGGDIERVSLDAAAGVLRQRPHAPWRSTTRGLSWSRSRPAPTASPSRPSLTVDGHALLLINPHTSFFFRSELQMTSDEGLNAYGAVDLGPVLHLPGLQRARRLDAHLHRRRRRRRVRRDHRAQGRQALLPLRHASCGRSRTRPITLPYRTPDGAMAHAQLHRLRTHHGPIVRADGRQVDRHRADEQADRGAGAVASCAPRPPTTPAS